MQNDWISHAAAIELSGMSRRTFQRREAEGLIRGEKRGQRKFYLRVDVDALVTAKRAPVALALKHNQVAALIALVGEFAMDGDELVAAVARALRRPPGSEDRSQ